MYISDYAFYNLFSPKAASGIKIGINELQIGEADSASKLYGRVTGNDLIESGIVDRITLYVIDADNNTSSRPYRVANRLKPANGITLMSGILKED